MFVQKQAVNALTGVHAVTVVTLQPALPTVCLCYRVMTSSWIMWSVPVVQPLPVVLYRKQVEEAIQWVKQRIHVHVESGRGGWILWRSFLPSVLWRCWLGGRKGIQPVKNLAWWGTDIVICLERGANDLHMVHLMPLPPHHLGWQWHQNGLLFCCWLTQVVLEKRPWNGCSSSSSSSSSWFALMLLTQWQEWRSLAVATWCFGNLACDDHRK